MTFHRGSALAGATAAAMPAGPAGEIAFATGLGARDAASTTRELIRRLEFGGWASSEAGNLVGLLYGLRPVDGGWSLHEIEHLRFLRALFDDGSLEH